MSDVVRVEGLVVDASIGVYPHEKQIRQRLVVDLTLHADLSAAGASDQLSDTLDYDHAARVVREVATSQHHDLIETIAESVAARLLADLAPKLERIDVRIQKPGAVPDARSVVVEISRAP